VVKGVALYGEGMKTTMESLLQSLADRLEPVARAAGVPLLVRCGGGMADDTTVAMAAGAFELVRHVIERTARGGAVVLMTEEIEGGVQSWHVQPFVCAQ
jgi:hypothetical protein